jgi:hypothetical protein
MPYNDPPETVPSIPAAEGDEWDGPWGSIASEPQSVETLCIQIEEVVGKPRIYYYPYRTIGKWNWQLDDPETLEIQIGGIQLSISGKRLRRLADALNLGQLRLISVGPHRPLGDGIYVHAIVIEAPEVGL